MVEERNSVDLDSNEPETAKPRPSQNSWLICRSKSYSNRVYYYNTITGESAWNLSEAELKKAKQRNGNTTIPENYPEPNGPPAAFSTKTRNVNENAMEVPPRIYNKQMNNTHPSEQPSPFTAYAHYQCSNCLPLNSIPPPMIDLPTPGFNPQVWSVPPPHRLCNGPNVSFRVNNEETEVNVGHYGTNAVLYKVPVIPDISMRHPKNYQNSVDFVQKNKKQYYQRNNNYKNNQFNHNKNGLFSHKNGLFNHRNGPFNYKSKVRNVNYTIEQCNMRDLRELLSEKRNIDEQTMRYPSNSQEYQRMASQKLSQSERASCTLVSEDYDEEDTLDEEWLSVNAPEGRLYMDLACLRQLAGPNAVAQPWYIVAGSDVLLKNFKFLNVLINSDDKCMLMVPEAVKSAIKAACFNLKSPNVNQARVTMRYLDQWFESGLAKTEEHDVPIKFRDDTSSCILNCCLNLLDQNFHVVLLCSKKEKYKYNNVMRLSTFTIKEIKEMLKPVNNVNVIPKPVESLIKIVIPNDSKPMNKVTIDTGVQTEFNVIVCDDNIPEKTSAISDQSLEAGEDTVQNNVCETTSKDLDKDMEKSNDAQTPKDLNRIKRREIKLKFSVPSSKTDVNSGNRKPKWRRRGINLSDSHNASIATDTSAHTASKNSNILSIIDNPNNGNVENVQSPKQFHEAQNQIQSNYSSLDENVESEASSCVIIHRNPSEKITIDESSTSGVISNSVSVADSESIHSVQKQNIDNVTENKNVMFEVTDFFMEKSLKLRCDEWVSRFVQIMEEVLTQVLLRDPTILNPRPPPWTLIEATECAIVRFINDNDITDAGNKLLKTLKEVSKNGNIEKNMQPTQYMKMYSYGVYLIDSLHNVLYDFVDLQTAEESLSKLLNEIQNLTSEPVRRYSFTDSTNALPVKDSDVQANSTKDTETASIVCHKGTNNNTSVDVQSKLAECVACAVQTSDPSSNNQDTLQKNIDNDSQDDNKVKFIRKIDIGYNYFESRRLQKTKKATPMKELSDRLDCILTVNKRLNPSNSDDRDIQSDSLADSTKEHSAETKSTGPKFIKTITGFDMMKSKLVNNAPCFSNGESDYSEEDVHYSDSDLCGYENRYYESCDYNAMHVDSEEETNKIDANNNLRCLIKRIVCEIKEAYLAVHKFCEKTSIELSRPVVSDDKRKDIKQKANEAHINISNLCNCLKSVTDREETSELNCDIGNIGILLNKTEEGNGNNIELVAYRTIIDQLKIRGNVLLESLNIILDTLK